MLPSTFRTPILALVLILTLFYFQNCSHSNGVNFSGSSASTPKISINSEAAPSGGGSGFDGKPYLGDYVRSFPSYECIGTLNVSTDVKILNDNCRTTDYIFQLTDSILEYNGYNNDFLGVGSAPYERVGSALTNELPVAEAWCQFNTDTVGFDVVIKSSQSQSDSQAKIYLGSRTGANLPWDQRFVAPTGIQRTETATNLTYQSDSLFLEIQKSSSTAILATGRAIATIDGVAHNHQLSCRLASPAPIEDMGTGLTQLSQMNAFTTDFQEGVCSHPGVLACENLESRSTGAISANFAGKYKLNFFAFASNTGASVNNTNFKDGQKAIEWLFNADSTYPGMGGFTFSPSTEIYTRFYLKFSTNFVFSRNSTDISSLFGSTRRVAFEIDSGGAPRLRIVNGTQNGLRFSSALGALNNIDQWHCVEIRVKTGSALSGELELWIDDSRALSQNNLDIDGDMTDFSNYLHWNCNSGIEDNTTNSCQNTADPLNLHPAQSVFFDNYVVARQRIGCFL